MKEIVDGLEVTSEVGTFAIVPDWIVEAGVSDKAVRLWIILWQYADRRTGRAWPSHATLAERLGCSTGHVRRLQNELVEVGCITVEQRWAEDGSQRSNMVTLRVTPPTSMRTPSGTGVGDPPAQMRDITRTREQEPLLAPTAQKSDTLRDALIQVCQIDTASLTTSSRGAANKAHAELRQVGATSEQVYQVAKAYRLRFPTAALTPMALAKHWAQLIDSGPTLRVVQDCEACAGSGWITADEEARTVTECECRS